MAGDCDFGDRVGIYKEARKMAARKKRKDKAEKRAFEEESGNVFADLGLDDADERFTRAKLGFRVYKLLIGRELKNGQIADLLAIKHPECTRDH